MADDGLLRDRVALVTGVEQGLGRSIASSLSRERARVVLAGPSPDALAAVASAVPSPNGSVLQVPFEVTRPEDCRHLVDRILESSGRLDILVDGTRHAGLAGIPIDQTELSDWRQALDVNLLGPLSLVREVVRAMRTQGGGSIVVIGAPETRLALERTGVPAVSRGALGIAVQVLAREVGADGIRANTVVPGFLDEPRLRARLEERAAREGGTPEEARERLIAEHALGRLTDPTEVADAVVFLASDLSRIVTGQSLDVNCGSYFH